jgi:serine/threonine protein kinase
VPDDTPISDAEFGGGAVTRHAPAPVRPELPAGYEYVGELGRGGMGVVYLARDEKGQPVAVKTLTRLDPARLDYLKREFAALAGLRHENLVAIYRQVSDGTNWFCVMEYVEGEHLLHYLRNCPPVGADDNATALLGPPDHERLRSAFAQLAAGLHALHGANMLHRDIKSSNVKVDRAGRVKVLDFGLVAEIDRTRDRASGPVGTIDHMSPEQLGTQPLTPASDWYSFGVILYSALGGRVPFSGSLPEIMRQKERVPPPPSRLVTGVPPDLEALCLGLLHPDPAERPTGAEVLRRLGAVLTPVRPGPGEQQLLLGRSEHLATLHRAATTVRRTRTPLVVEVHGPSGAGKTALVERFLRDLRDSGDTVILTGRCFEQSSVPYKALDGLIDALCRHLRRMTRDQVAAVLPLHPGDLARLFPVLGRLQAVAEAPVPARTDDPLEARRRAFAALRELFARIGVRRPLILFADDLQWGDSESAALLTELVRPPDAPPLLFLASYRRRDADVSPFVCALREVPAERFQVAVDPLSETEAHELATALLAAQANPLLSSDAPLSARFAQVIARESAGNPLLIHELVEFQSTTPESTNPPTIDTVIRTRLARVDPEPRRLLEVVALATGPLDVESAFKAADIPPERQSLALDLLLNGRAVRTAGGGDTPRTVEPFHDRVRESVAADIPDEVRSAHHRALGFVLTVAGSAPEVLAHHFTRAGEMARAAEFYAQAGEQSAEALAFDRAAEQYRLALEGCPDP